MIDKSDILCLTGAHKWHYYENNYAIYRKCKECGKDEFVRLKGANE